MDQSNLNFFLNENIQINLQGFVINLILTLILCFILRYIYIKFSTTLSNKYEFSKNFVILGLTTCIVITIVKSSLALSLGLVGALSIVRFRAAIKEPEELIYLFLVIAIGLGNGAGQIKITSIGVLLSILTIVFFSKKKIQTTINQNNSLQMSISIEEKISEKDVNTLIKKVNSNTLRANLISINKSSNFFSVKLEIVVENFDMLEKINSEIIDLHPKANISAGKDFNVSL